MNTKGEKTEGESYEYIFKNMVEKGHRLFGCCCYGNSLTSVYGIEDGDEGGGHCSRCTDVCQEFA